MCFLERGTLKMAKIINIFDSKAQEKKNDWRKVLTGKEYEVLKYNSFTFSSKWSFPVCNHRECVTKDKLLNLCV